MKSFWEQQKEAAKQILEARKQNKSAPFYIPDTYLLGIQLYENNFPMILWDKLNGANQTRIESNFSCSEILEKFRQYQGPYDSFFNL